MLNVHLPGAFARLAYAASASALLAAPTMAQTYHDSGGTIAPGVAPLVGCSSGGNCSGPVSSTNPMPVSGTFSATLGGFAPGGAYSSPLAVSTTSARVALPTGAVVVVYNAGSASAYVILGNSSATATISDDVVPAGGWMAFTVGSNTYLAAITASGTTTLNVSGGSGLPTGAGGGGAGASIPTGTAGSPNAAVLSIQGVAGGTAQSISAASLPLPSGAATAANQEVTTAGASASSAQAVQGVTGGVALPATVAGATDAAPATQTVAAADVASTPATVANGQVFITGTPTANSAASFALAAGYDTVRVQVTGTWVGTLAVEMSPDNGATWVAQGVHQTGTTYTANNFTANFLGEGNASGFTNVRVRASGWTSGTATVKIIMSINPNSVYLANSVKMSDSTTPTIMNTIKAASTAAAAGDTAQVVALSPNSPLPAGSATIGVVNHAPTSSSSLAVSHAAAASLGTSLAAKASAGNLYGFNCTAITGGAAGYCVAVNAAAAPSTGTITGVLDACYFAAGAGGCSLSRPNFPANYSTGIVILGRLAVHLYDRDRHGLPLGGLSMMRLVPALFALLFVSGACAQSVVTQPTQTSPFRNIYTPGYYEITIPSNARTLELTLLGTAGGGGSGARRATGGIRTGGAGASGGNTLRRIMAVADIGGAGAILPIYVGQGGIGGAAVTSDTTNGNTGGQGMPVGIGTILRPAAYPFPTLNAIYGIASNSTTLVAVGAAGTIYSSTDGATWTAQTSGTSNQLNSVVWASALNEFIAVGASGTIATSANGSTWTVQTSGTANALNHIMFDGTTIIAVGASGTILTSANGTGWTTNAYSSANTLNQVAWNGSNLYIAVDSAGNAVSASSPTGTWTAALVTVSSVQGLNGIAYGNGTWIANAALNGNAYTSSNGSSWTNAGARFQRTAHPMNYLSGSIPSDYSGGFTGLFLNERDYSFDGVTWRRIAHSGGGPCHAATIFNSTIYCSTGAAYFVDKISRIITAFTPIHVMGTYGGAGGSSAAATTGFVDGSSDLPGAAGASSAISGSAPTVLNAPGSGGGGGGGGATAANGSITSSLGTEGSNTGDYVLQGFNGVTGLAPNNGGAAGTDPTLEGSSGGGGGAWTTGAAGQNGGNGGTPGGGGGGGAASDNGYASGAGGNGGDGQVRILWF